MSHHAKSILSIIAFPLIFAGMGLFLVWLWDCTCNFLTCGDYPGSSLGVYIAWALIGYVPGLIYSIVSSSGDVESANIKDIQELKQYFSETIDKGRNRANQSLQSKKHFESRYAKNTNYGVNVERLLIQCENTLNKLDPPSHNS